MLQNVANFFVNFPHELAVFLVAMTPILEQRVGLPLAILIYHMPVWKAYAITMVGNLLPVSLVLYFADPFNRWVHSKSGFFLGKAWANYLTKAQNSFAKYEKYGLVGLMLFVALPIPGSGIFTGAAIAFLMGVPFRHSWPYLCVGVLGSGLVTLLLSVGAERIFF